MVLLKSLKSVSGMGRRGKLREEKMEWRQGGGGNHLRENKHRKDPKGKSTIFEREFRTFSTPLFVKKTKREE